MFTKIRKLLTNTGKRYYFITSKKLGDFSVDKSGVIPAGLADSAKDINKLIGIVGFGNQGKAIYSGITALAGTKVKIICDTDPQKLSDARAKNLLAVDNLDEFIKNLNDVDLVIIATTAPSHIDILSKLLMGYNGKILIEKPLDSSLKKSVELSERLSVNESGRIFINYAKRHLPDLKNVKEIIKSPAVGRINSIHFSIGNGELAMITSHYIDYLKYLLEDSPAKVQAILNKPRQNTRGDQYEDNNGSCTFFYNSGVTAFFDFSSVHTKKDVQIFIKCENGYIFFDEYKGYILIGPDGMPPYIYNSLEQGTTKTSIQRVIADILAHDTPKNKCSFEDATEVVKIIYACHYSSQNNGIPVAIKNDFAEYSSIAELKYP